MNDYLGRWLKTISETENIEFNVISVDEQRAIAHTDNNQIGSVELMTLDFDESYLHLLNPIELPDVANTLKSISASSAGGPTKAQLESKIAVTQTEIREAELKELKESKNESSGEAAPELKKQSPQIVTPVETDTEVVMLKSAIEIAKRKKEPTNDIHVVLKLQPDFDLLAIAKIANSLGIDDKKALRIIINSLELDDSRIKDMIVDAIIKSIPGK